MHIMGFLHTKLTLYIYIYMFCKGGINVGNNLTVSTHGITNVFFLLQNIKPHVCQG